ncbi:MAG: hypothetical protein QM570_12895 [Planctomycetota bacterium]|jgi:hypothetical protein|nr:hypothetical protein [Planctomycetota bacterium]
MVLLLRSLLIAYVVLWVALLIGCLCKREFCPIFTDSRRTRLFWLASFVFVNPLLTLLYLVFGQVRSPQARPVRAVRDLAIVVAILGFFINVPGLTHLWMQPFRGRSKLAERGVQTHLAAIEATNNSSTTSMTSSGDNSRLACRRVAIIVEGDHSLLRRVAAELVEPLRKIPGVEDVELCDEGVFPAKGRRAPGFFVRLYLDRIEENLIPYLLKLTAEVGAEVGRMPLRSMHHYRDTHMPPLLDFSLQINMKHVSTTTGYESVRYTLAARNIAKDLGQQIAKPLGQWRDKHGLLPELPDDLYGTYVPHEIPSPVQGLEPRPLGSYAGLLTNNETYLEFTLAGEPVQAMRELHDAMTASGWKERSSDWESEQLDLRFERDSRCLHVFGIRPRDRSRSTVTASSASEQTVHRFGVADVQRYGDEERKAVLDGLLAAPAPTEHLMLFERMFDRQQEQRWLELLENQPPRDPWAQLRLAEMYERRDRTEEAVAALVRARALLWAKRDDSTYRSRMKRLAKELESETLLDGPPAPEDLRGAGFLEVSSGEEVQLEAAVNEPMSIFYFDSEGEPVVSTATVRPVDSEPKPFRVEHLQRRKQGSSWGSHGGFGIHGGPWQALVHQNTQNVSVVWTIEQIAAQPRFKANVAIEEH